MWMCFECCCIAVRENVGWQHAVRVTNRHGLFLPALSSKLLFKKKKKIRLARSRREKATVVVRTQ